MLKLTLKEGFDESQLEGGAISLGYKEIKLLFNVGPYPGGGNYLIVEADGQVDRVNSNDLIHDLEAYEISVED